VENEEVFRVSGRTQRAKGAANEAVGKTKGTVGHATGNRSGEAKAAAQVTKGKVQKALGRARNAVRGSTR
jgi:uncharacterized protein YjbJ (UPF0337 family)